MNNFYYENQGTNTLLVYKIGDNDDLDTMSLGMLTNNSIPGFAPAVFTQMDDAKYIKYNVSAKVPVSQLFSGAVNKKRLLGVFNGIIDAMLAAEDYMLDPSSMLLNLDYIFADVSTCQTVLICLPVVNEQNKNTDLATFFKNIVFTTQFDQTENCDHVAQILNYLNSTPTLNLENFKELLRRISGIAPKAAPAQPQPVRTDPVQAAPQAPVHKPTPTPAPAVNAQPVSPQAPNPQPRPVSAPVKPQVNAPAAQPSAPASKGADEKEMSWMYLMQHYNKENAAIYKAQQDAKKSGGAAPMPAPVPAQKAAPQANAGFAIPGQNAAPAGFAIPGQPVPAPAPAPAKATAPQPAKVPAPAKAPAKPVAPAPAKPAPSAASGSKCPKCGAAMAPNQAFCTSCGTRVGAAPQPVVPKPVAPQPVVQQPIVQQPAAQQFASLNFGETTIIGGGFDGETTVLGTASLTNQANPHLVRLKNNEKIPLNKPMFKIGRERSYVDYCISDNGAISKGHANIVNHNGEYFVVDTNSRNHTFLNGTMIQSGLEAKLAHGDKIRLGNEDFEFKMF